MLPAFCVVGPNLSIAIVEPQDKHYYQAGWTLVGGGAFDYSKTKRPMSRCIPKGAQWINGAASEFAPERNVVVLKSGEHIGYRILIICPGIQLNWDAIEGLPETLGKNNVTSNYLVDLAPYTWQIVQSLKEGTALFTQPLMPIKCPAGPQKAMYLSCDHWRRQGALGNFQVEFNSASGVLFSVPEFVPPLMQYVRRYNVKLALTTNLKAIDGPARKAWFQAQT